MIKKIIKNFVVSCLVLMTMFVTPTSAEELYDFDYANSMGSVIVYPECIDGNTVTLYCCDIRLTSEIKVYRGTSPYGRFYYVGSADGLGTFTMTGLTPYKTYYWKVVTEKWDGSEIAVRDVEIFTYLHDPKNAIQNGKKLSWSKVKSAQGYNVYYQDGVKYRKLGTTKQTTYTVKNSKKQYYVCAYRKVDGTYKYSGKVKITKK